MFRYFVVLAVLAADCDDGASRVAREKEAETEAILAAADKRVADEAAAIAGATKGWDALRGTYGQVLATIAAKPKPCTAMTPAREGKALSVGQRVLTDITKPNTKHSVLISTDGLTSKAIRQAWRTPFLKSDRRERGWDAKAAADGFEKLEQRLFPLVVIELSSFVAPKIVGEGSARTFIPGATAGKAYYVEDARTACAVDFSAKSESSVKVLTIDGSAGSDSAVAGRLANDLENSAQAAAAKELARLGKLSVIETPLGK